MKRVLKIIVMGASLGLVMLLVQNTLGLDNSTFFKYYLILAAIAIIVITVFNAIKTKKTLDVLSRFQESIENGKTSESLLRELEEVEAKNDDIKILNYIYINKSVYYSRINDYSSALKEIEKVKYSKLNEQNKMIYLGNIIGYLAKLNDREAAKEIYDQHKQFIETNLEKYGQLSLKKTLDELKF